MSDPAGRSELHYVAVDHEPAKHVVLARRLVSDGVDPDAADDQGWTPLHFAADRQAVELAEYLLSLGVAVDARDSYGNTPLSRATFSSEGRGDMIRLLRAHGADPCAANDYGVSPAQLARTIGNYPVAQFFDDVPT